MILSSVLSRPEYLYRPSQILRRLMFGLRTVPPGYKTVQLPWGLPIRVQPHEMIGSSVMRMGVHELATSECIGRLLDPGDLAVDAGANIGQMTCLMALRCGPRGRVIAFEPHPVVFSELQYNLFIWQRDSRLALIFGRSVALGDTRGAAWLTVPGDFKENHGIARLSDRSKPGSGAEAFEVPVEVLDAAISEQYQVGLMKIDVEGQELKVLNGSQRLIGAHLIRDIVFEEFSDVPNATTDFLEDRGYAVFRLHRKLRGPVLLPLRTPHDDLIKESPNYLATRDPERAIARLRKPGWAVYSGDWPNG